MPELGLQHWSVNPWNNDAACSSRALPCRRRSVSTPSLHLVSPTAINPDNRATRPPDSIYIVQDPHSPPGAGIYPSVVLMYEDCTFVWDRFNNGQPIGSWDNTGWCSSLRQSIALGYTHMAVVLVWLVWLIITVVRLGLRRRGGPGVGRAMMVSTGWLLSGWPVSAGEVGRPL